MQNTVAYGTLWRWKDDDGAAVVHHLYISHWKYCQEANLSFHLYADDTQIYFTFKPHDSHQNILPIQSCIGDIRLWMSDNFLNLNDSKTKFLVIGSQNTKKPKLTLITLLLVSKFSNSHITPSIAARNLGFIIESGMSHKLQISSTLKAVYCQIRNIGKIWKYLTKDATQLIIHSLVTSRLDMCNSLIYGIPHHQLHRLQKMTRPKHFRTYHYSYKKHLHITPVLIPEV